jgi:hypothetical protein
VEEEEDPPTFTLLPLIAPRSRSRSLPPSGTPHTMGESRRAVCPKQLRAKRSRGARVLDLTAPAAPTRLMRRVGMSGGKS